VRPGSIGCVSAAFTGLLCVGSPAFSGAQKAGSAPPSTVQEVIGYETASWAHGKEKDKQAYAAALARDFVRITEDGLADRAAELRDIEATTLEHYALSDMKGVQVAPNVVLLTYKFDVKLTTGGQPFAGRFLASSVWAKRLGKWVCVFTQETPTQSTSGLLSAQTVDDASLSARVDEVVAEQMREQKIPGTSLAVVRDGRVIKATGYGLANMELNVPVTPQSIFQTASLGKQLTATAVMMLVEAGKVGLDDKLAKYFPEESAAWKDIAIRHLLTHTSGIPDIFGESEKDTYTKGILDFRRDYTEDEIVRRFLALPLDFTPGERFNYSNTGYMLLGPLIQRVTGKPWAEFLQERIFRPLGMTSTRVMSEEDIIPNRCSGYRLIGGKLQNQEWIPTSLNATSDGGHYTSVLDLAKWDAALYGESLLKKSSLEQMWTPVKLNSGELFPYGFGWEIADANGHRVLYHTGGNQGFYVSISRYVDDRLTVVVMNNLDEFAADTLRIARSVAAVYLPAVKDAAPVKEWWLSPLCSVSKEGTQRCRPPG
jgi:CubicO group peptidase (beta-lactamase class C family)